MNNTDKLIDSLNRKFTSGNDCEVSQATITREEYEAIAELTKLAYIVDQRNEAGEGLTMRYKDAYESLSETQSNILKSIKELTKQRDELEERMLAAEKYISECPCDPDIYPEQLEAYTAWKEILSTQEANKDG